MAQAVLHQCPGAMVKYKFKCRNGSAIPAIEEPETLLEILNSEIDHLCSLKFQSWELSYLSGIRYFKKDFIDLLRLVRLNRDHINAYLDKDKELQIEIKGPIFLVIWFEVPVLAIVSELNGVFSGRTEYESIKVGKENLNKKIDYLNNNVHEDSNFGFADFGTRRRHSHYWHKHVIETLMNKAQNWFIGTSNLHFAMKYNIPSIGTIAKKQLLMLGLKSTKVILV
jgi:nicotinate phosphoribosyltransferase